MHPTSEGQRTVDASELPHHFSGVSTKKSKWRGKAGTRCQCGYPMAEDHRIRHNRGKRRLRKRGAVLTHGRKGRTYEAGVKDTATRNARVRGPHLTHLYHMSSSTGTSIAGEMVRLI